MISDQERYQQYLCSREWAVLRELVRERANGICERCRSNPGYAVHHLTYERKYQELIEDLALYCEPCHEFVHGKSDTDPCRPPINRKVLIDAADTLLCPFCREDFLHHSYVISYDRSEDAEQTTITNVARGAVVKQLRSSHGSGNPSSRRDGIAIGFWCECCERESELTFAQHKGSTYAEWREGST